MKIKRFEQEHCHDTNKGSIGDMKIKPIIKDFSFQNCKNPGQIFSFFLN